MKSIKKGFLSIALLACGGQAFADCESKLAAVPCASDCKIDLDCNNSNVCCDQHTYYGRSHYSARSQGANGARLLMGSADKTHLFGREESYGVASVALEYTQSFNSDELAKFFSPNCNNSITFGPNDLTPGTGGKAEAGVDVRNLDFGLDDTFKGTVCFKPKIKNFIVDLDFWFGLDEFLCGLWGRVNVPLTWTKWEVCLDERVASAGDNTYPAADGAVNSGTNSNAVVYKKIKDAWCGDKPFGDAPALRAGKLCCTKDDDFNVAGIRFDLGYDLWRRECGYLGLATTVVAGIGTHPTAEKLFQPVVGAQHAWQFGGNVSGAYRIWSRDENTSLTGYMDATLTHIFREKQKRLFGLKDNGAWSQYLLLKKFKADGTYDSLERAANILCHDVKVKANLQADVNALLAYRSCSFGAGLGFGIWYRSAEKVDDLCGAYIDENTYGVKGIEAAGDSSFNPTATIKSADRVINGVSQVKDATVAVDRASLLNNDNVDVCTGLHPEALSGKLFGYVDYGWEDCEWQPYVLVGGEVEFGRGNTALDQWGIILKAGVTY